MRTSVNGNPFLYPSWPWFMSPVARSINDATKAETVELKLARLAMDQEIWRHGQ